MYSMLLFIEKITITIVKTSSELYFPRNFFIIRIKVFPLDDNFVFGDNYFSWVIIFWALVDILQIFAKWAGVEGGGRGGAEKIVVGVLATAAKRRRPHRKAQSASQSEPLTGGGQNPYGDFWSTGATRALQRRSHRKNVAKYSTKGQKNYSPKKKKIVTKKRSYSSNGNTLMPMIWRF